MLSLSSQLRLKNILMSLATHEREIEGLRLQLCSMPEFEPYCAYRMLDTINKHQLHPDDIHYFFMQEMQQVSVPP